MEGKRGRRAGDDAGGEVGNGCRSFVGNLMGLRQLRDLDEIRPGQRGRCCGGGQGGGVRYGRARLVEGGRQWQAISSRLQGQEFVGHGSVLG